MHDKQNLIVCPADIEVTPIARYSNMLPEYLLQSLVPLRGWGYANNDIGFADGGYQTGICFSDNFEQQLELCDAVLFCDSYNKIDLGKYVLPKILKARESKKKILLSFMNDKVYEGKIQSALNGYEGATFINVNNKINIPREEIYRKLHRISTPVIFITGLGNRCNKFETQLVLRKYFTDMGYNVCQLGTKGYSSVFDFDMVPDFLFSDSYNMEDKIYLFNYYIRMLEKEKKPDVFIIGIPGGIMPFDDREPNGFGIIPYIISNAVKPDCVVLNIYYNSFTEQYFSQLDSYCKYKFGFEVTCFNIANTKYSLNVEDKIHYLNFLSLNSSYVMSHISEKIIENHKLFNALQQESGYALAESVYNALTGNISMLKSS